MVKADVVAAAVISIQGAQSQALSDGLGAVYDQGAVDQKASDGTLTQADLDAAIAAAVGPLNSQIAALQAQDASDIAAGQAALATLQASFDALSVKEASEAGVVSGLQGSIGSIQGALAALQALFPAPAPAAP